MNTATFLKPLKDNRHLFEQQKYIQDAVEAKIVRFSEDLNSYTVGWNQGDSSTLGFVNGAWFQWQEHQEKLKDHMLVPEEPTEDEAFAFCSALYRRIAKWTSADIPKELDEVIKDRGLLISFFFVSLGVFKND